MKWLSLIFILPVVAVIGFLVSGVEVVLPATPPSESMTYTPMTQPAPPGIGSYDVLGHPVSKEEASRLLQTEAGRDYLIHLRDICPVIPGQCDDSTITVEGDRGGIPQSF